MSHAARLLAFSALLMGVTIAPVAEAQTTLVWTRATPDAETMTYVFEPDSPSFSVPGIWFARGDDFCTWQTEHRSVRLIREYSGADARTKTTITHTRVPNGIFRCRAAGRIDIAKPQREHGNDSGRPDYRFRETPRWSTNDAFGWEVSAGWTAARWYSDGDYPIWDRRDQAYRSYIIGLTEDGGPDNQGDRYRSRELNELANGCAWDCVFCDVPGAPRERIEEAAGTRGNGEFTALEFAVACDEEPRVLAIIERPSTNWATCSPREEYQSARIEWEDPELEDWPPPPEANAAACATSDARLDGVGWSTWHGEPLTPADFVMEPRP